MKAHNPSQQEAYPPEIPVTRRHTHNGDPTAEARIHQDLSRLAAGLAAELGDRLDALLLVGAYARGEGGVLLDGDEPCGYPGYRCLLLTDRHGIEPGLLLELEQDWAKRLEIGVHLATEPTSSLPRVPASLWWLDIARGNVEVLSGDPRILQKLPALDVTNVPPSASGSLLTDAALGIAISSLSDGVSERDRIRQLQHAVIACGDARVLASGRFAGSMRTRRGQLEALRPPAELLTAYADAIEFLGLPERWQPAGGDSQQWQTSMLQQVAQWHLDFEAKRVGTPTTSDAFARSRDPVYTRRNPAGLRSRALNAVRRLLSPSHSFPYIDAPEEILPRAAVALAYGGDRPSNRLMAARLLGVASGGGTIPPSRLVSALKRLAPGVQRAEAGRGFAGSFYGPF